MKRGLGDANLLDHGNVFLVVDYQCTSNLLLFLASNFMYVFSSIYIFWFIHIKFLE